MLKNVTFTAPETLLEKARKRARDERTSLNVVFREWLRNYSRHQDNIDRYKALMKQLRHIRTGGPFSREQMNER